MHATVHEPQHAGMHHCDALPRLLGCAVSSPHTANQVSTMSRQSSPLLLLTGILVVTAGCQSVAENVSERVVEEVAEAAADEGVEIDLDTDGEGGLTVETDEGTFQVGGNTELPDGFPSSLPIPGDASVTSSMSQSTESGDSIFVQLSTQTPFDELEADTIQGLEDGGWEITDTTRTDSAELRSVLLVITGEGYEGNVSLSSIGGQVMMAVALEDPTEG